MFEYNTLAQLFVLLTLANKQKHKALVPLSQVLYFVRVENPVWDQVTMIVFKEGHSIDVIETPEQIIHIIKDVHRTAR